MNDLTIIYYSSNTISKHFLENTKRQLLKAAGDIPIVSITHKPMDLGMNFCVGGLKRSTYNIYKQALLGAKIAKTKYVATAEDDILYSPGCFDYRPPTGEFGYNVNIQSLYTWTRPPIFSTKNRRVFHSLIVERDKLIETLEERFKVHPDENDYPLKFWSEPVKYDTHLGVKQQKSVQFKSEIPNIAFSHPEALGFAGLGTRKRLGDDRTHELPYWGNASDILKLYEKTK